MSRDDIASYDSIYKNLADFWSQAKDRIVSVTEGLGLDSYKVLIAEEGITDEVRLLVGGALAYIRFKHNFKDGFIEYGALRPSSDGKRYERLKIRTLQFDRLGNIEKSWSLAPGAEPNFGSLHIKTLSAVAPLIAKLYFDLDLDLDLDQDQDQDQNQDQE